MSGFGTRVSSNSPLQTNVIFSYGYCVILMLVIALCSLIVFVHPVKKFPKWLQVAISANTAATVMATMYARELTCSDISSSLFGCIPAIWFSLSTHAKRPGHYAGSPRASPQAASSGSYV